MNGEVAICLKEPLPRSKSGPEPGVRFGAEVYVSNKCVHRGADAPLSRSSDGFVPIGWIPDQANHIGRRRFIHMQPRINEVLQLANDGVRIRCVLGKLRGEPIRSEAIRRLVDLGLKAKSK